SEPPLRLPAAPPRRQLERLGRLHGRLAVRAHLPRGLERRLADVARLTQARGANGAHEERRLDLGAANRAPPLAEPLLDRPDLEPALADVLEVLRRAEEHVDEDAEERREEPEPRRRDHEPAVLDPAAR